MSRIAMVLSNAFRPDLRVLKEARSIIRQKRDVTVVAWDREGKYAEKERYGHLFVKRIGIRAPYGTGISKLDRTLLFVVNAIRYIKKKDFTVIHCHDFDTLMVGVFFKICYKKKLVYDSHENFSKMIFMSSPRIISFIVAGIERFLLRFVDAIIVASATYGGELSQSIGKSVTVIGNWQEYVDYDREKIMAIRKVYKRSGKLLISYIGGLNRSRSIIPMIELVRSMPDITFLICGGGPLEARVAAMASEVDNVVYLGVVPQAMVPYYTAASDVIYYVMDYSSPTAKYNAPNSLGFALITGRAIIASDFGDLGRVVNQHKCGVIVHDNGEESLRAAVRTLCDKNLLRRMQENALNAGKNLYNWQNMEAKLREVYTNLEKKVAH